MDDIIDEIETEKSKSIFSWLAVICSIVSLSSFVFIMISMSSPFTVKDGIPKPPQFLIHGFQIFTLLALIMTVGIFNKKEPNTWVRKLGIFLSVISMLIVIGIVGFFYFIEITH